MSFTNTASTRITEHQSTAILLFSNDLRLVCMNPSAEDMLSVSANRADGMLLDEIWPNSRFFNRAISQCVDSGIKRIERSVEIDLTPRHRIKVDCMITPIVEEEHPVQILVELSDANAYERVINEVNQHTVQEAAKESIQGMAHEIKNPLVGIRGAAQLLEIELANNDLKEYTQIIINESDRLRKFIDRMLTPSRLSESADVNVHEVLEYVLSLVEAENSSKLDIDKDYDPSIPDVKADRGQLIQAILNLVRNAAQAIDDNGSIWIKTRIQRQVTIKNKLNRHVVEIEIIDDGLGIPPEIEASAFYPMVTGRAEGTGLGLSIAQQIIQSHGGVISYEREYDRTFFTILLPMD